jgi:cysteine-rich repeat protein
MWVGAVLACLVGCADFEFEEHAFCERNPERCGVPLPPGADGGARDGGTQTDGGLPDSGIPDAGGALCGNSALDQGEVCDDGNTATETSCPYDMPSCIRCNDTCSAERNLTGPYCGDNTVNGPETCDDGNRTTETGCPYGTARCVRCDAICSAPVNLTGPYCGDGTQNGPEACDDGNTSTETACPYGTPDCTACRNDCGSVLNLTGPYCGDGAVNGAEACDDGNADACGTCNTSCSQGQTLKAATGSLWIVSASNVRDGQKIVIKDGLHPAVTFELDWNGSISPGTVPVFVDPENGEELMTEDIAYAINAQGASLAVTARYSPGTVMQLVNDFRGSFGNQPLTTTAGTNAIMVSGMDGGEGSLCASGIGCLQNADCGPGLVCRADKKCGPP